MKKKKVERIRKSYSRVKTRTNNAKYFEEVTDEKHIIAMDNYFTLPKVIAKLRSLGIGIVGTARFRRSWPPNCLKSIDANNVDFNDFYWCIDEHGTLVGRWMDNGLVLVTSTVHKVGRIVKKKQKETKENSKECKSC